MRQCLCPSETEAHGSNQIIGYADRIQQQIQRKFYKTSKKFQRSALFAYGSEQKSFKHEQQRSADPIFDEMFLEFTEVINDNKNFKEYMNRLSKKVTRIMDAFIFQESYDEEHSIYSVLVYHIRQTIDFLHDSYGFEQDGNRVITLANYLYIKGNYAYFDDRKENVALKETFREFLKNIAETPYLYAKKDLVPLVPKSRLDSRRRGYLFYDDLLL